MESLQAINDWGDSFDRQGLVTFRLADQTYALPIEPIVRIIEMVTITPIPQVSSAVEGVINVRGVAVPVISLRRHFDLPEIPLGLRTPIVLAQIGAQTIGLIVDEVMDVLSLSTDQISSVADILPEPMGEAPILQGLVHIQNNTVLLLDVDHLLLPSHMQALVEAVATLPESVVKEVLEGTEGDLAEGLTEPPAETEVGEASADEEEEQSTEPVVEESLEGVEVDPVEGLTEPRAETEVEEASAGEGEEQAAEPVDESEQEVEL